MDHPLAVTWGDGGGCPGRGVRNRGHRRGGSRSTCPRWGAAARHALLPPRRAGPTVRAVSSDRTGARSATHHRWAHSASGTRTTRRWAEPSLARRATSGPGSGRRRQAPCRRLDPCGERRSLGDGLVDPREPSIPSGFGVPSRGSGSSVSRSGREGGNPDPAGPVFCRGERAAVVGSARGAVCPRTQRAVTRASRLRRRPGSDRAPWD